MDEYGPEGNPSSAAQQVLLSVARSSTLRTKYPTMTNAIDDDSLREIVNLAWRYQFDPDRYGFKRDIRKLETYVSKRVKDAMEGR